MDSTLEMVEQFAFQHFELFDLTDYREFVQVKLDKIHKNFELSQSPYKCLRDKARRSSVHKLSFVKYIWREIQQKRREIMLKKAPEKNKRNSKIVK